MLLAFDHSVVGFASNFEYNPNDRCSTFRPLSFAQRRIFSFFKNRIDRFKNRCPTQLTGFKILLHLQLSSFGQTKSP